MRCRLDRARERRCASCARTGCRGGVVCWISHRRKLEKMDGVGRGAGGGDVERRNVKTDRSESS